MTLCVSASSATFFRLLIASQIGTARQSPGQAKNAKFRGEYLKFLGYERFEPFSKVIFGYLAISLLNKEEFMPKYRRLRGVPIKKALLDHGLTQVDLAAMVGMPKTSLNVKILEERVFSDKEKIQISLVLNMPVRDLFPIRETTLSEQNTQSGSAGM